MPTPFLKWAGGKRALVPTLLERAPKTFGTYFEPFLGGGALFFALEPQKAVLYDANRRLVMTYVGVRDHVENVIGMLRGCTAAHSSDFYYQTRKSSPDHLGPAGIAAWFIYLNKTGFNGLYRVNKSGAFNVPMGKYANPTICDEKSLRDCARVLQPARLRHSDFRSVESAAAPGDFVYFDPPYVPLSTTANFTAYTAEGFTPKDQTDLRDLALRLKDRGVHVLLSNASTPAVETLYAKHFDVRTVEMKRAISSKTATRAPVLEYLIS